MNPSKVQDSGLRPATAGNSRIIGLLLLAVLVAAGIAVVVKNRPPAPIAPNMAAMATTNPVAESASSPLPAGLLAKISGRWQRADGGYVLEIKKAADDGQLEAAYFNPNPINISRAQATRQGSLIKVVVELRDTGYPGCLYTLLYDEPKDVLRGTYFQAAMNETYEISFDRLKE